MPRSALRLALTLVLASALAPAGLADWVQFQDETSTRLDTGENTDLGATDPREKDYAWGDVDQDGDIDLVIVRKEPFTSSGKDPNVLLINEGGVLVDRTAEFARDSDVEGDEGFLTPTNDRDVILVDVDLDGWLDMVTATTISVNDPKHIGHPRIYMNKGCIGACEGTDDWRGFRYEEARIPTLLLDGQAGKNPCFCSVSAGDVNGDGYPDLYFGDYDSGSSCADDDFNDRLLLNGGVLSPGVFTDATNARFEGNVPGIDQEFPVSAFGAANGIADLNGDGRNDIVKQTSLSAPTYVGNAYNVGDVEGFFDTYDAVYTQAPYFVSLGELNNDLALDMVITDDGNDRYVLNHGGFPAPEFISYQFSFQHTGPGGPPGDDGFGGNSLVTDLDHDGWKDVLITDIDVDISGCDRRMHIYRNLGGSPGDDVVLQEQTTGQNCENFWQNPATCVVASIPANQLIGVHDVAVFDLNGDGWDDMVVGRCSTTEIYMQIPTGEPAGGTPDGHAEPGAQLVLGRSPFGDQLSLSWGDSCSPTDTDYEIYEGPISDIGNHSPVTCTTSGSTTLAITPSAGSVYYLVVPHNGVFEGSYGVDSTGTERLQGSESCRVQTMGACD